ncbi:hypothetical protein [Cupriavidus campinensis]|uniref:hypothetical protein n=1 Tax=Cupriavidus campinensis TaxID=151783 RepID=UPI0024E1E119|nr:hypothetical protein [Cupriavidus campinensis]
MSKHTPGPWDVHPEECDKPYIRIRGTRPGSRYKVANVLTPVYEGVHEREAAETRANACLIAAAPELFAVSRDFEETLKELGLFCECGESDCRTTRLRAALAKATGA